MNRATTSVLCLVALFGIATSRPAVAQSRAGTMPLVEAAASSELPLGPWGPYARTHLGPCYLSNRFQMQSFAFPIVIGQRREEIMPNRPGATNTKGRIRPGRVVLQRRAMGLSPVQASQDDRIGSSVTGAPNRLFQMLEGNASGGFWKASAHFAPAGVTQEVVAQVDNEGKITSTPDWGAGEAMIEYFPAFAEPHDDGLLIRVVLTNESNEPQNYYVDLLGGLNTVSEVFTLSDLSVTVDPKSDGVVISHKRCESQFALAANSITYPIRYYQVNDAYFAPAGATTVRNPSGIVVPPGVGGAANAAAAKTDVAGIWGLTRVDDIMLAPGKTTTLFFCVGVGHDTENARDAAQTLLSVAEDAVRLNKVRLGLYTQAVEAQRQERFASGNGGVDRLMAQSLANIPFAALRRVGVPSRQPTDDRPPAQYQASLGAMMALAWSYYRPDWAAAQLNAWFLTRSDSDTPIAHPDSVPPINIFALWELAQKTHDRQMVTRFYPFAVRRYHELLTAGHVEGTPGLYAWTPETRETAFAPCLRPTAVSGNASPGPSRLFAPDYTAYVIRTAKTMQRMAEWLHLPQTESAAYTKDAAEAAKALNTSLWDSARNVYGAKPATKGAKSATPGAKSAGLKGESLGGLLPLIAGDEAIEASRLEALLKSLIDPAQFWSPVGLRSLSAQSTNYHPEEAASGVHIGLNWLFWKALLDYGEADTAALLATNLIKGYQQAQIASSTCPEWLDGNTGAACGVQDFAGDACALIPLYAAYHTPGTLSAGWDTEILDDHYDAGSDVLHIVFKAHGSARQGTLLCVMRSPKGSYALSGSIHKQVVSDPNGLLTIPIPQNGTTSSIDIIPVTAGADK